MIIVVNILTQMGVCFENQDRSRSNGNPRARNSILPHRKYLKRASHLWMKPESITV